MAATPAPVSATGEPVTVYPVEVMAMEPVAAPTAVGEKVTVMVQFAPAAKVVPHPPGARAKGPVTAIVMLVNAAPPVFVSVTFCDPLVELTTTFPKARAVGATAT